MRQKRNYHGLSDSGVFYRDRDEWLRYLTTRSDYDASTRVIGCYIALRINPETRETWPKQTTIADDTGLAVMTVKRAVWRLVSDRLLSVRVRRPIIGGRNPVNHYSLVHPADSEGSSMNHDSGFTHEPPNRITE